MAEFVAFAAPPNLPPPGWLVRLFLVIDSVVVRPSRFVLVDILFNSILSPFCSTFVAPTCDFVGDRILRPFCHNAVRPIRNVSVRRCTLQPPDPFAVTDESDGSYSVSYTANKPGTYEIEVSLKGQQIPSSPFVVQVMPGTASSAV
eukprot:gnl/Spiro4/7295_TR3817_c0_g1_i1.p2 gnl/Spiro4/7295_TR3817_c0_g1~~gnl/Spiro4/7295_TR3817_c0_g1_i1.p2  ORF type:complete len:155 (+),score=27.50 gnl/Spiro4/7295_TR3817_c0_g1_i1:28-465(+)